MSHLFGYEYDGCEPLRLTGLNHFLHQHSINLLFFRFSRLSSCAVRRWMYRANVWWCQLDAMSGCVYIHKLPIPHGLGRLQHLKEGLQVSLIFFEDQDIIPPVTIDWLILLRLFKGSFTRVSQDGINGVGFRLITHCQLLTGDLEVN